MYKATLAMKYTGSVKINIDMNNFLLYNKYVDYKNCNFVI